MYTRTGRGLFAAAVVRRFPLLPVEEEGRLNDPALRENFLERVFGLRRWKDFLAAGPTVGGLVEFHTAHKLLMMAHSPVAYRELGALVARGRKPRLPDLLRQYEERFMTGLALLATPAKNTNVLQHIAGYFKQHLTPAEKAELQDLFRRYHDGQLPLIVPITLLKHYVSKYDQAYLKGQIYLSPTPAELMLRNHV